MKRFSERCSSFFDEIKFQFKEDILQLKLKRNLPYTCARCELLGMCRDIPGGALASKKPTYKCYHGCLILNAQRQDSEE